MRAPHAVTPCNRSAGKLMVRDEWLNVEQGKRALTDWESFAEAETGHLRNNSAGINRAA
jgi:hypothetical protein